jgi:hypothetical protein
LREFWKNTPGNADECENKGLAKNEIRKRMKTKVFQIDDGTPNGEATR